MIQLQESPTKEGHVSAMVNSFSASLSSPSRREAFAGKDMLDLAHRVAQLEGQQQSLELRLRALESRPVMTAWRSLVDMGRRLEEEQMAAAHLRLRLEAMEEALKRDLVFQNQALERLETQVAQLRVREPLLELHGVIESEVRKAVRMEYDRLVLELLGAQVGCLGAMPLKGIEVEVEDPWLSSGFSFVK